MSSFAFGFEISEEDQDKTDASKTGSQKLADSLKKPDLPKFESKPVAESVIARKVSLKGPFQFTESFIDDRSLPSNARYNEIMLPTEETIRHFQQDGTGYLDGNGKPTDLIPNVYEGGAKTWECSVYLVELLAEHYKSMHKELRDLSVLELGCGSALPGLFCAMRGAKVDFQDYNKEVIEEVTIPNFKLNSQDQHDVGDVRFYSGDWLDLHRHLSAQYIRYDIILTAETIYNTANYAKLSRIFQTQLKPDGIIYLAAKNHYFGVGGGIDLFSEYLEMQNCWAIQRVKSIQTNVKCSILKITRGRDEVLI